MTFFKDEFEAKKAIADMLDKVTYGQAEALCMALEKWDKFDKIKEIVWVETNKKYKVKIEDLTNKRSKF